MKSATPPLHSQSNNNGRTHNSFVPALALLLSIGLSAGLVNCANPPVENHELQATPFTIPTNVANALPPPTPGTASVPSATATTAAPAASATPVVVAIPTARPDTSPVSPVQVSTAPSRVAQGHVAVVKVALSFDGHVSGNIDGRPIEWGRSETAPRLYWSVIGFAANSPLGSRNINVTARDSQGGEHIAGYNLVVVPGGFDVESIWVPPSQGGLLDSGVMTEEKQRVVRLTSVVSSKPWWDGPFIFPTQAEISSVYGTGRSYNGGPVADHHGGVDFEVNVGAPIHSSAAGVVVLAEPLMVRGNAVIVDHGMGVFSGYYHLSQINVTVGQKMLKGELIGLSGVTGLATGPHLHWDVIVNGTNVNGVEWVERPILP